MTAEELFYDLSNKYGEDFNWDMLPFSQSNGALDGIYYIFHLTYSKQNLEGFPKFERFADLCAVKGFIEQALIAGYT